MRVLLILLMLVSVCGIGKSQVQKTKQGISSGFYENPIFRGDYPDPSILRDGSDFYIVHSSFEYYPGLLIWHSKDLVNWQPLTHALNKYVGSVWAPDLVKFKGKYYIYFPANNTNYVVFANNIGGPWSEPVDLKIGNIDPGHVVDSDGNRYLYFNGGFYIKLSDDGLSTLGELKHSYDGWPIPREWSTECFCMEGPKLIKKDNYYYLTVAEGGTAGPATSHMVVSARSQSVLGPWENSPYNPVIHTKSSDEKWWSKGHGTIFDDADGKWWVVYHAYEKGYYNMGRQTLLEPVEWTSDGWFCSPKDIKADQAIRAPQQQALSNKFDISDSFTSTNLNFQWQFFGEYDTTRFHPTKNGLILKAKGKSVADCSPLLCMLGYHAYDAQVELTLEGDATAGLILFYNDKAYSGIGFDKGNIITIKRGWQFDTEKAREQKHVFLRLKNINHNVDMFYSSDGMNWTKTTNSIEVSSLNHNVLGDFLSLKIGLCSIGTGKVVFKNFRIKEIE